MFKLAHNDHTVDLIRYLDGGVSDATYQRTPCDGSHVCLRARNTCEESIWAERMGWVKMGQCLDGVASLRMHILCNNI